MKNIILQHWTGVMTELGKLSSANISEYAKEIGAEYQLLRGNCFRPNLKNPWAPIQKLFMLDASYDEYDIVVMLDIDMFIRKGMKESVFEDLDGVGLHGAIQHRLLKRRKAGSYTDPTAPWWGGAIYRLSRELRQKLRAQIRESEIDFFCARKHGGDEGLMHRLASLAKISPKGTYFPDNKWCCCSYLEEVEEAALIHIRPKTTPSPTSKTSKIKNYKTLVNKELI